MADPIEFCGFNKKLHPAPGTEDVVRTLHVHSDGREIISAWKLTDEELAQVNRTGEVWLSVASGQTAPPVYVSGLPLMQAHDMDSGELTVYHTDGTHVVNDARFWALLQHGDQKYGDGVPYGYHLEGVVEYLRRLGCGWALLAGGYGHDLEEDCLQDLPILERREVVAARLGTIVEALIWACTGLTVIDGVKQNRRARFEQQVVKIDEIPAAAVIKVADRKHNHESSTKFQSRHGPMYLAEVEEFDDRIGKHVPNFMREELIQSALDMQSYVDFDKDFPDLRERLEARIALYKQAA